MIDIFILPLTWVSIRQPMHRKLSMNKRLERAISDSPASWLLMQFHSLWLISQVIYSSVSLRPTTIHAVPTKHTNTQSFACQPTCSGNYEKWNQLQEHIFCHGAIHGPQLVRLFFRVIFLGFLLILLMYLFFFTISVHYLFKDKL